MKKWIAIIVGVTFLGVVALLIIIRAGVKSSQNKELNERREITAAVEVTRPAVGEISENRTFMGKVVSTSEVMVFSKIPGKVVSVPVKIGTKVTAGSTVAVVDYDQPGMKFRYYDATAPIGGEVTAVLVNLGDMVSPQTPLAVIVKPASVKIEVSVPPETLARMYRGQPVTVTARGCPEPFAAEVVNLPASLSTDTHMAAVEIRPTGAVAGLRVGMFAEVSIPVTRRTGATLVPPPAVRRERGRDVVYVVEGNVVRVRTVKTGIITDKAVEVLEGLKPTDEVIVYANAELADGVKVVSKQPYTSHQT